MRHALIVLAALVLAACTNTPRPFEPDAANFRAFRTVPDKTDITIETPANMPTRMADRLAAALAIELQSYGIVAGIQPARAPVKLTGAMSTRDAGSGAGIEVEIEWFLLGERGVQGPVVSKTVAQPRDYAEASDWLVSRIAQQAAPRVATLMGRPPTFEARAPGQVAAGVTVPERPSDPVATPASAAAATGTKPPTPQQMLKVMVAPVTGAPSDGNRQLFSGMRRALGSNKIIVIDKGGNDTFVVVGAVSVRPLDERTVQLTVKWVLKDPNGKEVGEIEQANPVPAAATRGSWAGFGDIVAAAAVEGVLELLDKASNKPR